jgi:thymidylate synthase (FAD)
MGCDLTVVNAARVSFAKESCAEGWDVTPLIQTHGVTIPTLNEKDKKLIRYLAQHNHWSPFAHASVQLHFKAPIFVARQLAKHQVGGVWNEVSRRYVESEPELYWPDAWRGKAADKKQGSSDEFVPVDDIAVRNAAHAVVVMYRKLLAQGVAPEQARMILPQNTFTEWYWTGTLIFWWRVYQNRSAPDAQKEVQETARQIRSLVEPLFPISWGELEKANV